MIKVLNQNKKVISLVDDLKDFYIQSKLKNGDKTLAFSLYQNNDVASFLNEEWYIETESDRFVVKSINRQLNVNRYICTLDLESLVSHLHLYGFSCKQKTLFETLVLVLDGSGWTFELGDIPSGKKTFSTDSEDAYNILLKLILHWGVEIRFDSKKHKVYIANEIGADKGVYFTDELNLETFNLEGDTYDFATRLFCRGKDNLTFASINGGIDYIEDYSYSDKVIPFVWTDERYEDPESLFEAGVKKLSEVSKPKHSYELELIDLAKLNSSYSFLDYSLGDTVTFISTAKKLNEKQRIVEIIDYPLEPERNSAVLSTPILYLEDVTQAEKEIFDGVIKRIKVQYEETEESIKQTITTFENDIKALETEFIQTTDSIKASVSKVEETQGNTYTKTETNAAIEARAKGVAIEVSKKEISNLQLGSANRIKSTTSIFPSYHSSNVARTETGFTCLGHVDNDGTVRISNVIDGNGWYTISFYAKVNSEPWDMVIDFCDVFAKTIVIPKDNYKYFECSFEVENYSSDVYNFIDFEKLSGQYYYFKDIMVVKGQKAIDYQPAYEDVKESIAKIDIKADEIEATVSQEITNLSIGGQNLFLGSRDFEPSSVWTNNAVNWHNETFKGCKVYWTNTSWYGYKYKAKNLIDRHLVKAGEPYTISCYVIASSIGIKGGFYSERFGYKNNYDIPTTWTQLSYTFTPTQAQIDATNAGDTIRFEPYDLTNTGHKVYVACYKLEKGRKATDYSNGSEDLPTNTQMNSAITQKANEITSTVEETKRVGVELMPQGFRGNSLSGYSASQGNVYVNEWGLRSTTQSWIRSELIQVDRTIPITYFFSMQNTGGRNPQTYVGFEQYGWNGASLGANDLCHYVYSGGKDTGYFAFDGVINANTFHANCRFIKLRVLTNWDNSGIEATYIHEMNVRQLRAVNSSTQISQLADRITSTVQSVDTIDGKVNSAQSQINQQATQISSKVDVNGVKTTIQQNPESVRIGFNAISNYFDLTSSRLRVGHNDGSYTEIGQNGVKYHDAYANWTYHSLMKQGWLGDIAGTSWSRTITLPSSFKGKSFSVIVSMEMVNATNQHDVIKHYKVTVPQNTVNYTNGTFVLNMSALAYWVPGQASATAITTNVSWIAIA